MQTFSCTTPGCAHVFAAGDLHGRTSILCPECLREYHVAQENQVPPAGDAAAPAPARDAHGEPDRAAAPTPPALPDASTSITRDPYADIPTGRPVDDRAPDERELDRAEANIAKGYYLLVDGRRVGPLNKSQLLHAGLEYFSLVWYPGAKGWRPARQVRGLEDIFDYVPPPPPGNSAWNNLAFLPSPRTLRSIYWWLFWLTICGLFFLALMIMFVILWENLRIHDVFGVRRNPVYEALAIFSGTTAALFGFASAIVFAVLLYQMWKVVQDGYASVSPGSAVGLLFVPIFNLFWLFIAIRGLAHECNQVIQRHGYNARPAPVGLALAYCICLLIPWLNLVVLYPMGLVTMAMLRTTAADIAQARLAEEENAEEP